MIFLCTSFIRSFALCAIMHDLIIWCRWLIGWMEGTSFESHRLRGWSIWFGVRRCLTIASECLCRNWWLAVLRRVNWSVAGHVRYRASSSSAWKPCAPFVAPLFLWGALYNYFNNNNDILVAIYQWVLLISECLRHAITIKVFVALLYNFE